MNWKRPLLLAGVVLFGAVPPPVSAGDPSPASPVARSAESNLAEALPNDAFFYVSFDLDQTMSGFTKLDLVSLLDEPEVQDFLAPMAQQIPVLTPGALVGMLESSPVRQFVSGRVEAGIRGVTLEFGGDRFEISPSKPVGARLVNRAAGFAAEVQLAMQEGLPASPFAVSLDFVVSVDGGPQLEGALEQALGQMAQEIQARVIRRTVSIAGHDVQKIELRPPLDQSSPDGSIDLYLARRQDHWWLAGNAATLERCLKGGGRGNLASSPSFARLRKRVTSTDPAAFVYFDVAKIGQMFRSLVPPVVMEELEILGLDAIEAMGYGASFVEGGVRDSLAVSYGKKPQGLLRLLECTGGGFDFLRVAPRETGFYLGARFDATRLVDTLEDVMDEVFPGSGGAIALGMKEAKRELGIDLRNDLLPAFGDELGLYLTAPGRGQLLPEGMLLLEVGDRQRFEHFLGMAREAAVHEGGLRVTELPRMPEGYAGYSLTIPDVPVQPALAVSDDLFCVALSAPALKKNLRAIAEGGPEATVAHNESFQTVLRAVGGGQTGESLSFLAFFDLRGVVEIGYQFLPMAAGVLAAETDGALDLALMPEAEVLARHFTGMAITGRSDERGMSLDVFSPTGFLPTAMAGAGIAMVQYMGAQQRPGPPVTRVESRPATEARRTIPAEAVARSTTAAGHSRTLSELFDNLERATGATIQYPVELGDRKVVYSPRSADLEHNLSALAELAGFRFEIENRAGGQLVVIRKG